MPQADNNHLLKPLLKGDHPRLREVSEPVTEFDPSLNILVEEMLFTMTNHCGRGLSAIQIGIAKRVIIALVDRTKFYVMINPAIVRCLNRHTVELEGCLSLPGKWIKVSRPAKCDVEYLDLEGHPHSVSLSGEAARVVQHEIDHLDGIMIDSKPLIV